MSKLIDDRLLELDPIEAAPSIQSRIFLSKIYPEKGITSSTSGDGIEHNAGQDFLTPYPENPNGLAPTSFTNWGLVVGFIVVVCAVGLCLLCVCCPTIPKKIANNALKALKVLKGESNKEKDLNPETGEMLPDDFLVTTQVKDADYVSNNESNDPLNTIDFYQHELAGVYRPTC